MPAPQPSPVGGRPSRRVGVTRPRGAVTRRFVLALVGLYLCVSGVWTPPLHGNAAPPAPTLTLQPPVSGPVTQPFRPPEQRWGAGHRGVDLGAAPGTLVRAAAAGAVTFAGRLAGRGVLSVTHDPAASLRTTYEPVRPLVAVGTRVIAGQPIGVLESPPPDGDGHQGLHWGLVRGEQYLDPLAQVPDEAVAPTPSPIILLPNGAVARPHPAAGPGLPLGPAAVPGPGGAIRPAPGPTSSPFGMRLHPVLHVWKLHDGSDIAAACGTPVRVMLPGRVVATESGTAYGNRILVQHPDGRRSGYAHLSRMDVSIGQTLAAGAPIGLVGSTGRSTGCHLHVMGWQGEQLVDPSRWW